MGQLNQSMHALRLRWAVDGTTQSVHACSQAQAGGGWDSMDLYLVNVPASLMVSGRLFYEKEPPQKRSADHTTRGCKPTAVCIAK